MKQTYQGKNVLVTGHTGFKGAWLSIWLNLLGAQVSGYSIESPTTPNLFELSKLEGRLQHHFGDLRNLSHLTQAINESQAEVIFHLAAQSIVLHGYERPHETFAVNVQGTLNLLEAVRYCPSVKAVVVITTDKCYENHNWIWGYRETDRLGGNDPYSASKAMVELAVKSYRESFFKDQVHVASARAGNVIGGGDFSEYRLLPDCMKALMENRPIAIRNAESVRPWLHVLDPLFGYLVLGEKLLSKGNSFAESWNFGPREHEAITVKNMVEKAIDLWGHGDWMDVSQPDAKPEMGLLKLNWEKAANFLQWQPRYRWYEALEETVQWYKAFESYNKDPKSVDLHETCIQQIEKYEIQTNPLERGISH